MKAKPGKSGNPRKAPTPTVSHADIDEWLGRQMPDLQPIVERLDGLVRKTIPGLHYAVKWRKAYYGSPDLGWVIEVVAYDVSVNVVFLGGVDFDDPPPDGTGRSRYIKVRSVDEADTPRMRKWIEQAARVRGWE